MWWRVKVWLCKSISSIQNRANPPLLWILGTASIHQYGKSAWIFHILSTDCCVSMRNKILGVFSLTMWERTSTTRWFPSHRQFQLRIFIILGGATPQPPPFDKVVMAFISVLPFFPLLFFIISIPGCPLFDPELLEIVLLTLMGESVWCTSLFHVGVFSVWCMVCVLVISRASSWGIFFWSWGALLSVGWDTPTYSTWTFTKLPATIMGVIASVEITSFPVTSLPFKYPSVTLSLWAWLTSWKSSHVNSSSLFCLITVSWDSAPASPLCFSPFWSLLSSMPPLLHWAAPVVPMLVPASFPAVKCCFAVDLRYRQFYDTQL